MLSTSNYRLTLLALIIMVCCQNLHGQVLTFTLGTDTAAVGDTIELPISASNFQNIAGYQGTISWDSAAFEFIELSSPTSGISNIFGNPGQGLIPLDKATFTWVDFSGIGKTFPDGSIVMSVKFVAKMNASAGTYPITIDGSVTTLGYSTGSGILMPLVNQGSITVSGCTPTTNAAFTFPTSICANSANPSAIILGDPGGSFSVDLGASIDAATGELDLSSTTSGNTYTITYSVGTICPAIETNSIQIFAEEDASFTFPDSVCITSSNPFSTITGTSGGVFTVDNGAVIDSNTGTLDLNTASPNTTYNITYQTPGNCPDTSTLSVFIADSLNASFSYPLSLCPGSPNPIASNIGSSGGIFSVSPNATINPSTGELDLATTSIGVVYTITYAQNDFCQSFSQQQITVEDVISPDSIILLDVIGECSATVSVPTTTDNCAGTITGATNDPLVYSAQGIYSITWTFDDGNGNQTILPQTVIVQDTTPPSVVCKDISVQLSSSGLVSISPSELDNGTSDACGLSALSVSQDNFTTADLGPNQVTLYATDVNGNVDSCIATVTVIDYPAPNAICQDLTVYLDSMGFATITAQAVDGGSTVNEGTPFFTISQDSFSCQDVGVIQVMLSVSDSNGIANTCMASVTVIDTIAPTMVLEDIMVYLDSTGVATVKDADLIIDSFDGCGIDGMPIDMVDFSCTDIGPNSVTVWLSDIYGNTSQEIAIVIVEDSIAPVVSCQDISILLDSSGMAVIDPSQLDAGSTDACGIMNMSLSQDTFTVADIGTKEITLTVVDSSGNSSNCVSMVTVEGTTSIKDLSDPKLSLNVYPNPFEDVLTLHWEGEWNGELSISILNQLGQIMKREKRLKYTSTLRTNLALEKLPTGIYIIQVNHGTNTQYMRVFKQ